ncbi:ninjurin-1-like [Ctenocephalides felis]|uniref:ninjurin-1-like n=1 Tax=Ctenocephalides felis TaxID=7515 RepID=UPI000E6E3628|nr:ninjurin-1-like [Ctenocephalides felis]
MDSLHLQPLRETDIENKEPIPPLAGPEIWDTDKSDGSDSAPALPQPGVDDGFFTRTNGEEDEPGIDDGLLPPKPKDKDEHDGRAFSDDDKHHYDPDHHHHNGVGSRRGSFPPFPYAPDFTPMTPDGDPRVIPDVNVYQHKKTLAQGMMDLALLSANANQLRYVLESYDRHPYYFPSLILISMSLVLQIAVGVGLIWNSRYNVKDEDDICRADKINNYTVIGIFLITIVNVFVSSFGVANPPGQTATT